MRTLVAVETMDPPRLVTVRTTTTPATCQTLLKSDLSAHDFSGVMIKTKV